MLCSEFGNGLEIIQVRKKKQLLEIDGANKIQQLIIMT